MHNWSHPPVKDLFLRVAPKVVYVIETTIGYRHTLNTPTTLKKTAQLDPNRWSDWGATRIRVETMYTL